MVCEKNNDVVHDFYKDPLKLVKNGEWLKVRGHTHLKPPEEALSSHNALSLLAQSKHVVVAASYRMTSCEEATAPLSLLPGIAH